MILHQLENPFPPCQSIHANAWHTVCWPPTRCATLASRRLSITSQRVTLEDRMKASNSENQNQSVLSELYRCKPRAKMARELPEDASISEVSTQQQ